MVSSHTWSMKTDVSLAGRPTCSVLQVKSDCSSPHTLSAATTSTMTRKINSTDSHIFPKLVEWRFAPTSWVYRAGQDILRTQTHTWGTQTHTHTEERMWAVWKPCVCTRSGCFLWTPHLMETEKGGGGSRWKQRQAAKQKRSLKEEEDEKEWKWEEEGRRPSASIHVNWWTSLPTVDCTELSPLD